MISNCEEKLNDLRLSVVVAIYSPYTLIKPCVISERETTCVGECEYVCQLEREKESVNSVLYFCFSFSVMPHTWDQFSLSRRTCVCLYMSVCVCKFKCDFILSRLAEQQQPVSAAFSVNVQNSSTWYRSSLLTVLHRDSDMIFFTYISR